MTLHLLQEIKTLQTGPWYQYDILLASRPYGWGYMLSTLDYLAGSDLDSVSRSGRGI